MYADISLLPLTHSGLTVLDLGGPVRGGGGSADGLAWSGLQSLLNCPSCANSADVYQTLPFSVILVDLLLFNKRVYRHLLCNRGSQSPAGRERHRRASLWRVGLVVVALDACTPAILLSDPSESMMQHRNGSRSDCFLAGWNGCGRYTVRPRHRTGDGTAFCSVRPDTGLLLVGSVLNFESAHVLVLADDCFGVAENISLHVSVAVAALATHLIMSPLEPKPK